MNEDKGVQSFKMEETATAQILSQIKDNWTMIRMYCLI